MKKTLQEEKSRFLEITRKITNESITPSMVENNILPLNEGNAFVGAAKKAKEEGKDSFKLDGKTYKVTVKKSENKK